MKNVYPSEMKNIAIDFVLHNFDHTWFFSGVSSFRLFYPSVNV